MHGAGLGNSSVKRRRVRHAEFALAAECPRGRNKKDVHIHTTISEASLEALESYCTYLQYIASIAVVARGFNVFCASALRRNSEILGACAEIFQDNCLISAEKPPPPIVASHTKMFEYLAAFAGTSCAPRLNSETGGPSGMHHPAPTSQKAVELLEAVLEAEGECPNARTHRVPPSDPVPQREEPVLGGGGREEREPTGGWHKH